MKIVCTQQNLKEALQAVTKIISNSVTLPILNTLYLKTESGQLRISSTNLEVAITTYMRCKIEEDGEVCVPARLLSDLVNSLSSKNINFETSGTELVVVGEQAEARIKTVSTEEFPLIVGIDNGAAFKLPSRAIKEALGLVIFASSSSETQPEISGILFNFEESMLTLVATDRYRLAEKKIPLPGPVPARKVIVPQKTALELARIVGEDEGVVEGMCSDTQIQFSVGSTSVISRLIDGSYPDYQTIIPASFPTILELQRNELMAALKTVSVFSENSQGIRFAFDSDLKINAVSEAFGVGQASVESKVQGQAGEITLNARYVMDVLNVLGEEVIQIKVINDASPVIIAPVGSKDYLYLIMPIKQ